MQRLIKAAFIFFAVFAVFAAAKTTVYAGGINGNESSVISFASGSFKIDGVRYRVKSSALGRLRAYLAQDDINLSASQASRARSLISSNIRNGIEDGYLVAIDKPSPSPSPSLPATGTETPAPTQTPSAAAGKGDEKSEKPAEKTQAPQATVIVKKDKGVVELRNAEGKEVLKAATIIKNTGYSVNGVVVPVFGGLLLLLMATVLLSFTVKK